MKGPASRPLPCCGSRLGATSSGLQRELFELELEDEFEELLDELFEDEFEDELELEFDELFEELFEAS